MMKFNSFLKTQLLLVIIALLTSCNLEDEVLSPKGTENPFTSWESKNPILENDYLVFENLDHLMAYASKIQKLTESEKLNWETNLGFLSMQTVYEEFLAYSEASIETGYDMSLDQIRDKYKDVLIIEDDGTFFLNASVSLHANILNQQGLVKVGNVLQKHMKNRTIIIKDGDLNKLPMAMDLSVSDPKQGIFVNYVTDNANLKVRCGSITLGSGTDTEGATTIHFTNTWGFETHGSSNDKYRLEVTVETFSWGQNGNFAVSSVNIKTQGRGFGGGWYAKKSNTTVRMNGTSITNSQSFAETIPNGTTRNKDDNKWDLTLFSVLSLGNPVKQIAVQQNGGNWNTLCYDLRFTSVFDHKKHTHSFTVDVN